ncbi:unnamed protein product [Gongylonema pulchrum]|uniref:Post-GPI attachment to proteins factor 3 n=1 Tax=Gongylonema pulchrum TaxID=637853 RepID=A0A183D6C8_9BILA|nr:unnamed protein product [Gongylonema pulchrum]
MCARLMGAYFLTSYVISTHALHWKEPTYRLVAVDSRSVICTTILIAQVWSQYAYSEHWNGSHWVGILLFSSWTVISILYRIHLTLQMRQNLETKLR